MYIIYKQQLTIFCPLDLKEMNTFQLKLANEDPLVSSIEPLREMAAYEALWEDYGVTFKKIAELFASRPGSLPSEIVPQDKILSFVKILADLFQQNATKKPGILLNNTFDYPAKLRAAKHPIELLYYLGDLGLIKTRSVAVVGSRKATPEGKRRTAQLVRDLVKDKFTIVSGLAAGIDSEAHRNAIEQGGKTIAVIGTPLDEYYPVENKNLQDEIAKNHLVVSQVPFYRYRHQDYRHNKGFFPERNKTMSALTEATIIVEASDTSGTLYQATAAIQQGRKLFILDSCFENKDITWPIRFEHQAIRVKNYSDIQSALIQDVISTD